MDLASMILLGMVLMWAVAAIRYVIRHGACGCGRSHGCPGGCKGCSGSCRGSHSYQCIHIRSTVEQGTETIFIIFPVQIHHRQCQEQLRQRHNHHVLMTKQNTREGPS